MRIIMMAVGIAVCLVSHSALAHTMLREDPEKNSTYLNQDEFKLRNDYEFGAEF